MSFYEEADYRYISASNARHDLIVLCVHFERATNAICIFWSVPLQQSHDSLTI